MFGSYNVVGADNQQERLNHYLAGYVDGEGSFHIGIQRSNNVSLGYQLVPEFHVSQNTDRVHVLELIEQTLGCGYIKANHRANSSDRTSVYVVRRRKDLLKKVIPFFERYQILSPKDVDFKKFAVVVRAMEREVHLERQGLIELLEISFSMNNNGSYRRFKLREIRRDLESSETIRQNPR